MLPPPWADMTRISCLSASHVPRTFVSKTKAYWSTFCSTIGAGSPLDEPQGLQPGDLAADGGVVASHPVGEVDDADRSAALDHHKQREERAV